MSSGEQSMSDIKERFGTGWIGTGSGPSTEDDRPRGNVVQERAEPSYETGTARGANPAFQTLGKQMIRFLREKGEVDNLYSLADKMKLGPDDLEPVVEWLAKNYYIRVEPDPKFGNHEIRLTGRAGELL